MNKLILCVIALLCATLSLGFGDDLSLKEQVEVIDKQ